MSKKIKKENEDGFKLCPKCKRQFMGEFCPNCTKPKKNRKVNQFSIGFLGKIFLVLLIAMIVCGIFFINKQGKNQDLVDAINLTKQHEVSLRFDNRIVNKPLYQFTEDFDPYQKTLVAGGIEYMAHNPSVKWNAQRITKYLYKISAINPRGWTYEFQVSIVDGKITPLNDNARILISEY